MFYVFTHLLLLYTYSTWCNPSRRGDCPVWVNLQCRNPAVAMSSWTWIRAEEQEQVFCSDLPDKCQQQGAGKKKKKRKKRYTKKGQNVWIHRINGFLNINAENYHSIFYFCAYYYCKQRPAGDFRKKKKRKYTVGYCRASRRPRLCTS